MANKRVRNMIIAVSLTAVVGIGGTLALLSDKTEQKTNVFTMGAGLSGVLKEPKWDGDNFINKRNQVPIEGELGKDQAKNFTPGLVINKDPAVENTSSETTAFVGVTIDYEYDGELVYDDDYWREIEKYVDIEWNESDWTFNYERTRAVLKTKLSPGSKSPTLFNSVKIKDSAVSNPEKADDDHPLMYDFDIILKGYLVQAANQPLAKDALNKEFPNVFNL